MHPIVAEQIAVDRRSRQLAEAEVHRRARSATAPVRRTPHWRARQARRLVALARRLDPGTTPPSPSAVPAARR